MFSSYCRIPSHCLKSSASAVKAIGLPSSNNQFLLFLCELKMEANC